MLTLVFAGFIGALVAPWIYKGLGKRAGWIIALIPAGLFLQFAQYLKPEFHHNIIAEIYPWIPSLGLNLSFYLDGLSLLFSLIITGIGTFIIIYTGGYMEDHPHTGRLYTYLLMFMASMLGVVLSSNLISLFIFWELTSISSYFLIGFDGHREAARKAATKALLVTGLGGLGLLVGAILMGSVANSFHFADVLINTKAIHESSLYVPIVLLTFFAAFTKSAQVPFHFWLPGAMEAPGPVSAYLHSATMVKAGVYLIARLNPVLGGTFLWQASLIIFGLTTMFIGAYQSYLKTDLKQILANSTVSVLGLLMFQIGIGSETGYTAAMVFLLAHALSKAALFLVAGAVDHCAGTRDVTKLGGLKGVFPMLAIAAGLAALSKTGTAPFLGFIGKELIYDATLHLKDLGNVLIWVAVAANIFLVGSILTVGFKPFFGKKLETPHEPHKAPLSLWIGPIVLAVLGLAFGLYPSVVEKNILNASVISLSGHEPHHHLALWHGVNPVLLLSLATLAIGLVLFFAINKLRPFFARFCFFRFEIWYDLFLAGLTKTAALNSRVFQGGNLRTYLATTICMAIACLGYFILKMDPVSIAIDWNKIELYEIGYTVTIIIAAIVTACAPSFLIGIFSMGIVGFGIATIFILFGAPDLALTQFIIETLTVILFMTVLAHFPKFTKLSSKPVLVRDAVISILFGAAMTFFVLHVTSLDAPRHLTEYFAKNSYLLAQGKNIVNVILVDFRGFDTMGEITVLAIAAIGIYGILKIQPKKG